MNFPWTRHQQRYEYIANTGCIDDLIVADVGCGYPDGSFLLSSRANLVYGIDPQLLGRGPFHGTRSGFRPNKIVFISKSIFDFSTCVDVVVAIEILEHMEDPIKFIKRIAGMCKNAFITSPLGNGKTRNSEHITEYTSEDFNRIVENGFTILDKKYQNADLRITDEATYNGDSIDLGHVVQMVWSKSNG